MNELSTCILKFQRSHGRRALHLDDETVSVTPSLPNTPGGAVVSRSRGPAMRTRSGEEKWALHVANAVSHMFEGDIELLTIMCVFQKADQICSKRIPTLNYSLFLANSLPVVHTCTALSSMLPRFLQRFQELVQRRIKLKCEWHKTITNLGEISRFAFALTATIALMLEDDHNAAFKAPSFMPQDKVMPLRVVYVLGGEYGVFMDPLQNTIHVSSLDISFLHEQFENSCRSLSRYNEICGVCSTLDEVEDHAKRLLGLKEIKRSEALDECQHAHCLFKLSLYSRELNNSLSGHIIEPSTEFKLVPDPNGTCVLRLLWSASWQGRSNVSTASGARRVRLQHAAMRWQVASDDENENEDEDDDDDEESHQDDDEIEEEDDQRVVPGSHFVR